MNRKFALIAIFSLATLAVSAHADIIFTLNQDACTGTCGTAPFGTITLHQTNAGTVTVTEMLAASERFAGTGAGDALEFNVSGPIIIGNLTTGFSIGPSPDSASAFGSFLHSVKCTACQGGRESNPVGPLSFTVSSSTGVTLADFTANKGGYFFSSDIVGNNGKTGNVAALAGAIPTAPTPEPVTSTLLGSGLVVIAMVGRRFRARS